MITAIEIPHLGSGQKVAKYKKIYKASTATLTAAQQLACLPVYIHRSEGEKNLAHTAATKSSVDEAFKFLEEIIDGKICVISECEKFFAMVPKDASVDSIRGYYFDLLDQADRAEMPSDVFLKRFLSNIRGGKKLFIDNKTTIKSGMTVEALHNFFKDIMDKIQKKAASQEPANTVIKSEPFVFSVQNSQEDSTRMPDWAVELKKEVGDLRTRMQSGESSGMSENEGSTFNENVFSFQKKSGNPPRKNQMKCEICSKLGHIRDRCFNRICEKCQGTGHDANMCPSKRNPSQNWKQSSNKRASLPR